MLSFLDHRKKVVLDLCYFSNLGKDKGSNPGLQLPEAVVVPLTSGKFGRLRYIKHLFLT